MVIERDGRQLQLTIKPTALTREGETAGQLDFIPDYGDVTVVISDVTAGSPAAKAGFQGGDHVVAVRQAVKSSEQVVQYIRAHKTEPIEIDIDRGGRKMRLVANIPPGEEIIGVHVGQLIPVVRAGPGTAARYAVDSNVRVIRLTGKALGQVF